LGVHGNPAVQAVAYAIATELKEVPTGL